MSHSLKTRTSACWTTCRIQTCRTFLWTLCLLWHWFRCNWDRCRLNMWTKWAVNRWGRWMNPALAQCLWACNSLKWLIVIKMGSIAMKTARQTTSLQAWGESIRNREGVGDQRRYPVLKWYPRANAWRQGMWKHTVWWLFSHLPIGSQMKGIWLDQKGAHCSVLVGGALKQRHRRTPRPLPSCQMD